ncbi:MAG: hypothetical protein V3R72_06500, partial [Gammaproteobacteria bacterium]
RSPEGSNHLTKGSILAAHPGNVIHANSVEPDYAIHLLFPICAFSIPGGGGHPRSGGGSIAWHGIRGHVETAWVPRGSRELGQRLIE